MRVSEQAVAGIRRPPSNKCGTCGQAKPEPRNVERHNLLFAILPSALDNWPESHPFQPMSTEHLRGWLLYKAGWCTMRDLEIGGPSKAAAVAAVRFFLAEKNEHRFYSSTARGIREYTPKSIAFRNCPEAQFKMILNTIFMELEAVLGVPIARAKVDVRGGG